MSFLVAEGCKGERLLPLCYLSLNTNPALEERMQAQATQPTISQEAAVAEVIHVLRWRRGWSLKDLETKTGVPELTLWRIEGMGREGSRRRAGATGPQLRKIAEAFGLSADALMDVAERYSATGLLLILA